MIPTEQIEFFSLYLLLGILLGKAISIVVYHLPIYLMNSWKNDANEILGIPICQDASHKKDTDIFLSSGKKKSSNLYYQGHQLYNFLTQDWHPPRLINFLILEILSILIIFFCVHILTTSITIILGIIFCTFLLTAAAIDFETMLLPDEITWPLMTIGLLASYLGYGIALSESVLGLLIGYYLLWSIYWCHKITTGQEGLGFGDFKLTAAMGAWLGWRAILPIIACASALAVLVFLSIVLINYCYSTKNTDKSWRTAIPFGPYLSFSGAIFLLFIDYLPMLTVR